MPHLRRWSGAPRTAAVAIAFLCLTALAVSMDRPSRQAPPPQPVLDDPTLFRRGEVPDDPYLFVRRSEAPTTAAAYSVHSGFVSVQVNVDGAANNIFGDAANEPSIAVDPNDPLRMAIGWRPSRAPDRTEKSPVR